MSNIERTEYQNIEIEDIDQSIYDWFNDIVNAHIQTPTREKKKVPVLFGSGERWATGRDKRGLRDKNGVLILPVISIKRTGIDRSNIDMTALGTETEKITIARRIDKKTSVVQNAISSRTLPNRSTKDKIVYEITTIPFPDRSVTTYEVLIQTQYTVQMNTILEKIFDKFDNQSQFVAPLNVSKFEQGPQDDRNFSERKPLKGYYFVGFANTDLSDAGNFDEFTDTERIVKYSFNVTVPSYLQLDPDGERPAIQVEYTSYDMSFSDECVRFVDNPEDWDIIFSVKKPK